MTQQKDTDIVVNVKDARRKGFIKFMSEVNEQIKAGNELILDPPNAPRSAPSFRAHFKPTGKKVEAPEPVKTPAEKIEELTGKKDLMGLAKELNIEVPEDVKAPLSIKKFLRENIK
jgi:hypothetical protein